MKTNDKKIFGRWFEVMTAGTSDKVALYWYAEPSVLTHRSWCGDYTRTHAHTHTHTHTHPQDQNQTKQNKLLSYVSHVRMVPDTIIG